MRLGKQPKKYDRRTLQLGRYLPLLPAPPAVVDHASRLPADLGQMGNDRYGSCTISAAGHMVQSWSVYAERGLQTIPDDQIIATYLAISPRDQGAFMLDALNYWRKTGVGPDKIEAFVETAPSDLTQAKLAIQYFGSCYIGMALPDVNTFGPWTTPSGRPNPYNGHAVNLCAYDDGRQMFKVATWGEIWDLSYSWFQAYADECYAVLNDLSLIAASGATPEGFKWTALQEDMAHLKDPVTPPSPPPPPPVPVPEPTPPVPEPPAPVPVPVPEPVPDPPAPAPVPVLGGGMQIKSSVRMLGLRPEVIPAVLVAQEVLRARGFPWVWTSGSEGTHAVEPPSEHYQGNAADGRIQHVPVSLRLLIFQEIVVALGGAAGAKPPSAIAGDYEVRWESIGTTNEHLHLAFRPRRPLVTKL